MSTTITNPQDKLEQIKETINDYTADSYLAVDDPNDFFTELETKTEMFHQAMKGISGWEEAPSKKGCEAIFKYWVNLSINMEKAVKALRSTIEIIEAPEVKALN